MRSQTSKTNVKKWREVQERNRKGKRVKPIWLTVLAIISFIALLGYLIKYSFDSSNQSDQGYIIQEPLVTPQLRFEKVPNVEELLRRLRKALAPFQTHHLKEIGELKDFNCDKSKITWTDEELGYIAGCATDDCKSYNDLNEAKNACINDVFCTGLTYSSQENFELRGGAHISKSDNPKEMSIIRTQCTERATPMKVWNAFREAIEDAVDDKSLNLDTKFKTREDDSIYLSISTYRDESCPYTLKNAFLNAKHPEKLFVGIVQQNCDSNVCYTGTGWGNTRRWVSQDHKDTDCIEKFCKTNPIICEKQIQILRLSERESYGPFFGRYVNSKLYRGENHFLQIDAHTYFRDEWDALLVEQMRLTKSYPFSVISNYPPGGNPRDTSIWGIPSINEYKRVPSGLCGCSFEDAGGKHHTVRLVEIQRNYRPKDEIKRPRHSAFVAAGFFIAHGSLINNVPFDPFMPFLFMGEEISMSIRFWTSGYDIYAPSVDVLKHEYVRKDGPKFWESLGMCFSSSGIHNGLTDLIIPRVQRLVGWKEDAPAYTDTVFSRIDQYSNGNKRTAEQFVKAMNINLDTLNQEAPAWCLQGTDMPAEFNIY